MSVEIDVQVATDAVDIPATGVLRRWAEAAVGARKPQAALGIRIVDAGESQELNRRYRGCDRPTNVLAFAADLPAGLALPDLGDLVVCHEVVRREAGEQGKSIEAHWAHMVVHGTLHLLGFEHGTAEQAREMEALEVQILAALGYSDPYQIEPQRAGHAAPAASE
jgi:probable rRNA maturation factor